MKKKAPIKRRDILRLLSGAAVTPVLPYADWMLGTESADQRHAALTLLVSYWHDRTAAPKFAAYASLLGNLQLIRS